MDNEELEALKTQIEQFMKSRPKIEEDLRKEKEDLELVLQNLRNLKQTVKENKAHLAKTKAQLDVEVNKKNELEENVLKVERILDLMRKELKKVIQRSNQITFVEPEEYREFKRDASKRILCLLQEESTKITKRFRKKHQNEFTNLTHVEEKSNEIERLVSEINEKEKHKNKELEKLHKAEKQLEISKEELKQMKTYRLIIYGFCVFLI